MYSELEVPVDDDLVAMRYVASGGVHRVLVGPSRARFAVETFGREAPAVAWSKTGPREPDAGAS